MIYVLGNIYNEISLELEKHPRRGESVVADTAHSGIGGRGANQAIAIAKLSYRGEGGRPVVKLISRVGNDLIGTAILDTLNSCGVDTKYVQVAKRATGIAITGEAPKETREIIYNGANTGLSKTDVDEALEFATSADTLLCSLEVPLYLVMYALRKARMLGMTTALNPSPVIKLPEDMYCNVDMIILNEDEAHTITGINVTDFSSQVSVTRFFHSRGVHYVAITLGSRGATLSDGAYIVSHIPSIRVEPVDTAGAGDVFVGALTLSYPHVGMYSFEEACRFANRAAALTVSKPGSTESMPKAEDVYSLYISNMTEE